MMKIPMFHSDEIVNTFFKELHLRNCKIENNLDICLDELDTSCAKNKAEASKKD